MAEHPPIPPDLEEIVEDFELQRARRSDLRIADYVPNANHPQYNEVVVELVRVDLEFSYREGQPRSLEHYLADFPDVLGDPEILSQVAFEDYRLAFRSGAEAVPSDYSFRFGIDTTEWPVWSRVFDTAHRVADGGQDSLVGWSGSLATSQLTTAADLPAADDRFPRIGDHFGNFLLVAELGRGAFGRVYLAKQGVLADRFVALKVTVRATSEPQRLAELQHTHIVPVYSVHEEDGLQGLCMPFLGAATLADVQREIRRQSAMPLRGQELTEAVERRRADVLDTLGTEQDDSTQRPDRDAPAPLEQLAAMTYVDAITWIATRVADGLAHAHDSGVIHRDLKPANILLADTGQPLILDFNLSTSTGGRGVDSALVGGTLPYMAPEHIRALRSGGCQIDARSDVFAMGVILFELLAGKSPYPIRRGPLEFVTARMLEDRSQPPPSVCSLNAQVSPDLAAIIAHCLEPEAQQRYASARELRSDLQRHLDHHPPRFAPGGSTVERIQKWGRRHPRLASGSSIGAIGTVILLGMVWGLAWLYGAVERREAAAQARQIIETSQSTLPRLAANRGNLPLLEEAIAEGRKRLTEIGALQSADWKQAKPYRLLDPDEQRDFVHNVVELQCLVAQASFRAAESQPESTSREAQFFATEAARLNALAREVLSPTPAALELQKALIEQFGSGVRAADKELVASGFASASNVFERSLLLYVLRPSDVDVDWLHEFQDRVDTDSSLVWFCLGNLWRSHRNDRRAETCFSTSVGLAKRSPNAFQMRGALHLERERYSEALNDFERALEYRPGWPLALFGRALALDGLSRHVEALECLNAAVRNGATETRIHFVRSRVLSELGRAAEASAARRRGLELEPRDWISWISRGVVKMKADPDGAVYDFQQAVRLKPSSPIPWRNIASVRAKRGRLESAIEAFDRLLELDPDSTVDRTGRGVLYGRLGRRREALRDAGRALRVGDHPTADTVYRVATIYALTSVQRATDAQIALQLLRDAALRDPVKVKRYMEYDPDLQPLRAMPAFRELEAALAEFQRQMRQRPPSEPPSA